MDQPDEALILFAHGARDPQWRAPLDGLHERMQAALPGCAVSVAFLEFMSPGLGDAIDAAVARGAGRIEVAPVFWAAGGHLRNDVPVLLDAARARHPGVEIGLWPALGESDEVLDAVAGAYRRLWARSRSPQR
ncbi:sirohydrochlorin chelatase [Quisquiliibacterium transsilvanicum]|uniref:Sirohydrochlorin cobaltochelatase n=1 Tax=Quisquiliibacterium transsilvanicum TaxID=1549638 RepID=A0A7W8M9K3_9BURK|nr:CbiX/SirB N-terminal domain-containing protein [Quisquiliibacterium transsilvanicum]MBB5273146.1 sirohydrochlorin cobaltochelatase [Quisquiliibacterium transsilvanicum]